MALEEPRQDGRSGGADFRQADPIVRKAGELAKSGVEPTGELASLLTNIKQTGGWDGLVALIYNTTASLNGFDQYGHFGRTLVTLSNCTNYSPNKGGASGCVARFTGPNHAEGASSSSAAASLFRLIQREQAERDRRRRRR